MTKQITLENYQEGSIQAEDDEQTYLGVDVNGTEYLIKGEDYLTVIAPEGQVVVPRKAYEVVSANPKERTAKVREVTEKGLLKLIGLEFDMRFNERSGKYD